jgi:hypothetical protein
MLLLLLLLPLLLLVLGPLLFIAAHCCRLCKVLLLPLLLVLAPVPSTVIRGDRQHLGKLVLVML